jgi:hypothetical protein
MLTDEQIELLRKHVKLPVRCDKNGLTILDANNDRIMDVRGWGRLSKFGSPWAKRMQKIIGDVFAEALNEKFGEAK